MSSFLTPDVYTEEVPTLPPSVADVSTAVPAFIGYTEKAVKEGKSVAGQAVRISTLLEYKEIFGEAQPTSFSVSVNADDSVKGINVAPPKSWLYYALDLYFKNGGGECYIISVGTYSDQVTKQAFLDGLETLSKEDEPTLIMLGEATQLASADYYEVCKAALSQCADLKDRFCVFDVRKDDAKGEEFRNGIGTNNLKYGAAYTPYLQTSLNHIYKDSEVQISGALAVDSLQFEIPGTIKVIYSGPASDQPRFKINKGTAASAPDFTIADGLLTITNVGDGKPVSEVIKAWEAFAAKEDFDIKSLDNEGTVVTTNSAVNDLALVSSDSFTLASVKSTKSALYSKIVSELAKQRVILPPSAAVAGAYSTTDRTRGVWKAPANISLNAVIGPVTKITSADQEKLNVDANAGKSINAIRSFTGKGTLIWGARTLAGNDNEWRYVSVRRLFNTIEEATKKASYFAVFENNDAATWLKVKAMIDSYLYGIWQQGALTGSVPEQAYFVNIGLGKTMTQQDILEGRMIVEIGIAAVRPAEFVVLRFSHKLQEAN
ncbi:phage tail sheath subtilisin-like domain-containing protein [Fulvivirga ulvae]|uniref:phage tail sheath family protein n=1 Tax=Fulvivirga ulvae TaxID=2904245 RepID=UPI001F2D7D55|nr:phage tail sheath C-terminal domain-containing protein [Fulvivirga ulvae]UII31376.1 phage tail sheath subtilisin-like domain-containing protein [Fulvivirga ulvae]